MNKAPYPVVPRSTNKFEFQQPDRRDKKERGDHMDAEHKDAAADSENEAVDRERCGTLPQRQHPKCAAQSGNVVYETTH